jgi:hypothetical protein
MRTLVLICIALIALSSCKKDPLHRKRVYVDTSNAVVTIEIVDTCYHFCGTTKDDVRERYFTVIKNRLERRKVKAKLEHTIQAADMMIIVHKVNIVEYHDLHNRMSTTHVRTEGVIINKVCNTQQEFVTEITGQDEIRKTENATSLVRNGSFSSVSSQSVTEFWDMVTTEGAKIKSCK